MSGQQGGTLQHFHDDPFCRLFQSTFERNCERSRKQPAPASKSAQAVGLLSSLLEDGQVALLSKSCRRLPPCAFSPNRLQLFWIGTSAGLSPMPASADGTQLA